MSVWRWLRRAWAERGLPLLLAGCGAGSTSTRTPVSAAPDLDTPSAEPGNATSSHPTPESMAGIKAFDSGNYAAARASFAAAARKNPKDYDALYNLGMANEKLGDKAGAEAAYKDALLAKPDFDSAAAELCAVYVDAGRLDEALAVGRAGLARHPSSAALHENLGVALAARGDQEEATQELGRAIAIQPSEPMLHLTLAHWLNAWHVPGAVPHLDTARDLVKQDYGMMASIGHEYRMAGDFEACVTTFDRTVQMKDGGEVRTERALCKLGLKDEKGTLDDLQTAVQKEPTYAPAHYYLGGRLANAKHFKEAAAEYAKYLSLEPNGSLAKPATDRLTAARAARNEKGGASGKR